jgi:hypothetical protein
MQEGVGAVYDADVTVPDDTTNKENPRKIFGVIVKSIH